MFEWLACDVSWFRSHSDAVAWVYENSPDSAGASEHMPLKHFAWDANTHKIKNHFYWSSIHAFVSILTPAKKTAWNGHRWAHSRGPGQHRIPRRQGKSTLHNSPAMRWCDHRLVAYNIQILNLSRPGVRRVWRCLHFSAVHSVISKVTRRAFVCP